MASAFAYYREHGSDRVAERFLAELERAAHLVAAHPELGTATLKGRRLFPMRRFP